jgi:hypothetical protein
MLQTDLHSESFASLVLFSLPSLNLLLEQVTLNIPALTLARTDNV